MTSRCTPHRFRRLADASPGAGRRRVLVAGMAGVAALTTSLLAALLGAAPAAAQVDTARPVAPAGMPPLAGNGDTVLTIARHDAAPEPLWQRDLDLAILAGLPQHTLVVTAPWYRSARRFTGPLLRDVLAAAGETRSERLTAVALNDYRADIPLEDADRWPVIVALRVDDRPVAVRDKGPLMIMYPFDDDPTLRQARYYGRAVWQLRTLELR